MKKTFSIVMVIAMLCALLASNVSAEQTNMEVTIPKFTAQPTVDGCISVEEWGEKTVRVVTDGAATVDDLEIGVNEELGLKNFFYYFTVAEMFDSMAYDLWLRWDDENLYIGAIVDDPDPFSLVAGGDSLWRGDSMQFILDFAGPNAIMFKDDENYNYKTDSFNGGRYNRPWSKPKQMSSITMGLVEGTTPAIVKDGADIVELGAQIGITYVDNEDMTATIQYECIIPWVAIDETATPAAGDAYGMTLAVNCSDATEVNAWLQWGHGLSSVEENSSQPRETRGGSQAVVLGETTVTPAAEYPVATEKDETDDPGLILTIPTVSHYDPTTEMTDDGGTNAEGEVTSRVPVTGNHRKNDTGLSTGAMIGITCGIVVAAVVVIIVVRKKFS